MSKIQGFTLIELLVVIAVLGVLSGIVLVAVNPSKRLQAARDTQRLSFVKQIKNAATAYYTSNQRYPGCKPSGCTWTYTDPTSGVTYSNYYGSITGTEIFSTRLKEGGFLKNIPAYPNPPADQMNGECSAVVWSGDDYYNEMYYVKMCFESWDTAKYNKIQNQNFAYCGSDCNSYSGCRNCKYYCYLSSSYNKYPYCLVGYYKYPPSPNSYGDFEVPPINP